jgi:hypothetical protein
MAEQLAREVPNLTLKEALRLLFLCAEKDPFIRPGSATLSRWPLVWQSAATSSRL